MPRETFRLHIGEVQSDTHMRAAAERHIGEAMARALCLFGEAQGIEGFRVGPDLRHMVGEYRIDPDHGAGRDRVAFERHVPDHPARDRRHWRPHSHRFLERHFRQRHGFETIEGGGIAGRDAVACDLFAQFALPLRVSSQRCDERRQRRG
jgi:hypothetical protein